jgi:hypothetical protein
MSKRKRTVIGTVVIELPLAGGWIPVRRVTAGQAGRSSVEFDKVFERYCAMEAVAGISSASASA